MKNVFSKCNKCGETKEISAFPKNKSAKSGFKSTCKECNYIVNNEYYKNNTEKTKLDHKKYYENNKEDISIHRKSIRTSDDEYYRKLNLWRYNLTYEEFLQLLNDCNNSCSICGLTRTEHKELYRKDICIDHNHDTGEIRGILCVKCNSMLGQANESIEILKTAINYLDYYNGN